MLLVVGLGMNLISRARTDTPLDAAFVCLLTLFLFSWGGHPWVRGPAIEGNQIQGLVTDPTEATVAGATIEADQTDSGHTRLLGGALGGYIIQAYPCALINCAFRRRDLKPTAYVTTGWVH